MSQQISEQDIRQWVGRERSSEERITKRLLDAYHATLDPWLAQVPEGFAPLGIHWCLATPSTPMADLGEDGHERRGDFLPPIPRARRMWAGGAVEFILPMPQGATVRRRSRIEDVTLKQGRTGALWFVNVSHEYCADDDIVIRERQDIVYRQMSSAAVPSTRTADDAPGSVSAGEEIHPSSTLLFRYSALTFNGHRIHYDADYARDVEGYPGLVVHGPLQATLLMNLAARAKGVMPQRFEYRGVRPAIAGSPLRICREDRDAGSLDCWTANADGQLSMTALATFPKPSQ